ncbi:Pepco domain-containing protein [Thiothrix lacustris]|uniref:Pepco domain-containing protein n=1 Tax=Thiothrix lacustris TaxID=525917 RepID=UPI0027E51338|nr:hypothetical protein [Thiothrix lacustris]WMP17283.1 hypothetical protein RCS87_18140 [Thiothrix lacustris]
MKELPVIFPQEAQPAESVPRGFDSLGGGRLGGAGDAVRRLPTEKLAASLSGIKESLDEIFASITAVGNFELNEIKLTLEITAEGGFALVGLAKAGAKGGITLSFAPPKKA